MEHYICRVKGDKDLVTLQKIGDVFDVRVSKIVGLSSDTKPIKTINNLPIANGSTYLEINTSKTFIYDAENHKWHLWSGSSAVDPETEAIVGQGVIGKVML